MAAVPDAAKGTPFGARIHAIATYLKTFQALSYERLQGALADLFGLTISQGGLMNMLRRAQEHFVDGREAAVLKLRQAKRRQLGRDRGAHRRQQLVSLGLPL